MNTLIKTISHLRTTRIESLEHRIRAIDSLQRWMPSPSNKAEQDRCSNLIEGIRQLQALSNVVSIDEIRNAKLYQSVQ